MAKQKPKSKLEWFKKNIVIVPVVAAIIAGTFTSVRYVLNLTDTITANQETIIKYRNEHITFRKELEKRGLNVLDLRDKFEAISNNPLVELHFAKDGHWNETGNAIAAKEIISFILK